MQSYSKEFRRDVLAACDSGIGTQSVALQFGVSESWVRRINQQRRETGQIAAKTTRNRTPTWQAWADWLKDTVAAQPDLYRREIKAKLKEELGIDTSEAQWSSKAFLTLKDIVCARELVEIAFVFPILSTGSKLL